MKIEKKEKTRNRKNGSGSIPLVPATALLSEHVLAREWMRPEENAAWDYL